ncbi:hypothetical protein PR048_030665 [Dryococelus australis]|uniref:Uncharacterized protein n=1 Tax=Dryococelus australis TaxID=614101 RepID=A0ABQ9GDE8_9NEOP|nr:hypothetical protein PR048_030665 [Dryococelus australis]
MPRHITADRGRGGAVVRLLASHLDEPGSIPGGVALGSPRVVIVPDDADRGSPVSPAPSVRRCFLLTSLHPNRCRICPPQVTVRTEPVRRELDELSCTPRASRTRGKARARKTVEKLQLLSVREVSTEQLRNGRAGETGDTRKKPLTSGIARHDSHIRKSESDPVGNRTRFFSGWQASGLTTTHRGPNNNGRRTTSVQAWPQSRRRCDKVEEYVVNSRRLMALARRKRNHVWPAGTMLEVTTPRVYVYCKARPACVLDDHVRLDGNEAGPSPTTARVPPTTKLGARSPRRDGITIWDPAAPSTTSPSYTDQRPLTRGRFTPSIPVTGTGFKTVHDKNLPVFEFKLRVKFSILASIRTQNNRFQETFDTTALLRVTRSSVFSPEGRGCPRSTSLTGRQSPALPFTAPVLLIALQPLDAAMTSRGAPPCIAARDVTPPPVS